VSQYNFKTISLAVYITELVVSSLLMLTAVYATYLQVQKRSIKKLIFYLFCMMTLAGLIFN